MKNVYVLLFICSLFYGCSNDSVEATSGTPFTEQFASKPEANPMFDHSYKGIYKGIITGDISGAIYVNIYNDNQIKAKLLTNDNKTYVLENVPLFEGDNTNPTFDYRKFRFGNENINFEIKLDETGENISIPEFSFYSNNEAKICIKKETSNSLIKCYTGTFNDGIESGKVNFTSDGGMKVSGISRETTSSNYTNVEGTLTLTTPIDDDQTDEVLKAQNEQYVLNANLHIGEIRGVLDHNNFNGYWMLNKEKIGVWSANRLL